MIISDNAQPESNPKRPLFLFTVTWVGQLTLKKINYSFFETLLFGSQYNNIVSTYKR